MHCKNCGKIMVPTLACQGCGWKAGTPTNTATFGSMPPGELDPKAAKADIDAGVAARKAELGA